MMRNLAALALVLLLAASCATGVPVIVKTKATLAYFCGQVGSTLSEISVFRKMGALTRSEIRAVEAIKLATKPFCPKGVVILDIEAAIAVVERQLIIAAALQRKKDLGG